MFLLLISIRYEHGGWWPNLPESNFDHVGSGPGLGYNCNIPLNKVSTLKSFEICYFSVSYTQGSGLKSIDPPPMHAGGSKIDSMTKV